MAHDILIVDDEADIRMLISGILEDEGYQTREAGNSDEALEQVRARMPALIVLDVWLQGSRMDGQEILKQIHLEHPEIPVVMISGHGTIEMAVAAIQDGAYDFVEKPFKSDRLLLIISRAIEAAQLRQENKELKSKAGHDDDLIGVSSGMNQVRQQVEKVAMTGSRVLITGGPGTGKEVVARLLHTQSRRNMRPFIAIACSCVDAEGLECELFGTEPGSAEAGPRQVGALEKAHGGTLLLDEVGGMPASVQSKLVRVLQENAFHRVGGTDKIQVDVRIIASTNRDLKAVIEAGAFREDLYYRLNVVPLTIPGLKERRDDIPVLAKYFLEKAAENAGQTSPSLGDDAIASLQAYDWPGNVRQLKNAMDWLLIMMPADHQGSVRADMLPPEITGDGPAVLQAEWGGEIMSLPLREARELFEREYLLAQVTRFGGNISKTASFVGMERSALHRKLKLLGVTQSDRAAKAASKEKEAKAKEEDQNTPTKNSETIEASDTPDSA